MSTAEQRKRLKQYSVESDKYYAALIAHDYQIPPIERPVFPEDLRGLTCGAKTQAGHPCKQKTIYASGRCKFHGGCSTGPKTEEGKNRSKLNGLCPKKKRTLEC